MKQIFKALFRLVSLLAVVLGAFFLAKNWRSKFNNTEELMPESEPVAKLKRVVTVEKKIDLSPRQQVVYAIIRGKKSLEMKDLLPKIPGVTERTLRRDLLKLQEAGLITKQGTTKASSYVLRK